MFLNDDDEEKTEFITAIEGKKLKSLNNSNADEKKTPLIIPCQTNQLVIKSSKSTAKPSSSMTSTTVPKDPLSGLTNNADIDVIRELISDSINHKKKDKKD